jgi:hypothetical protein
MGATVLKEIDFKDGSFMANGKKYYIESTLSYGRWMEYEKLQIEIGFGIQISDMFEKLKECYELLNNSKFADSAVYIRDMMTGVAHNIDSRTPAVLQMCALFVNHENEDRRVYDSKLMDAKIQDWIDEGISMQSFFLLGLNLIPDYITVLKENFQDILNGKAVVAQD